MREHSSMRISAGRSSGITAVVTLVGLLIAATARVPAQSGAVAVTAPVRSLAPAGASPLRDPPETTFGSWLARCSSKRRLQVISPLRAATSAFPCGGSIVEG